MKNESARWDFWYFISSLTYFTLLQLIHWRCVQKGGRLVNPVFALFSNQEDKRFLPAACGMVISWVVFLCFFRRLALGPVYGKYQNLFRKFQTS